MAKDPEEGPEAKGDGDAQENGDEDEAEEEDNESMDKTLPPEDKA